MKPKRLKMSDHELTEDDHEEINVLDTDSRLSHSESESRSRCSTPEVPQTSPRTPTTLPFSISSLLGERPGESHGDVVEYHHSVGSMFAHRALVGPAAAALYPPTAGVLRVPAHRPLAASASPPGVFAPWPLGLDPVLHRSAAAAAFASQVVKDRLSGKSEYFFS